MCRESGSFSNFVKVRPGLSYGSEAIWARSSRVVYSSSPKNESKQYNQPRQEGETSTMRTRTNIIIIPERKSRGLPTRISMRCKGFTITPNKGDRFGFQTRGNSTPTANCLSHTTRLTVNERNLSRIRQAAEHACASGPLMGFIPAMAGKFRPKRGNIPLEAYDKTKREVLKNNWSSMNAHTKQG